MITLVLAVVLLVLAASAAAVLTPFVLVGARSAITERYRERETLSDYLEIKGADRAGVPESPSPLTLRGPSRANFVTDSDQPQKAGRS